MRTIVKRVPNAAGRSLPTLNDRLAARIAAERKARDWTVESLAARSGVSRAMIGKIERGAAHPTASLLGKLSAAFAIPLSTLFASVEDKSSRLAPADGQPVWRDPNTGYVRRSLSPPGDSVLQMTLVDLPARAKVAFAAGSFAFVHQQIWVIDGALTFHEGRAIHHLRAGDCLMLGPPENCLFENTTARRCRYVVAVVRR